MLSKLKVSSGWAIRFLPSFTHGHSTTVLQDNQLYVADPLALQNIIVKEQDIFEETSVFIEYVMHVVELDLRLECITFLQEQ